MLRGIFTNKKAAVVSNDAAAALLLADAKNVIQLFIVAHQSKHVLQMRQKLRPDVHRSGIRVEIVISVAVAEATLGKARSSAPMAERDVP